ncbi:MAG: cob(I)yrinic acid a,c-diamide adenosyltransferase [Planctomycetota bacterium]|nr:MAG: cob(I)yrinic acid a,c-diamide adenosyltransferase [Planctomycetota bacterium]
MSVYTRTGDEGDTGLFGGRRVPKDHLRIQAYGEVDELNSVLGWCLVAADTEVLRQALSREMNRLFVLGSYLATPGDASPATLAMLPPWEDGAIARLERETDFLQAEVGEMRHFILPGGTELAARLHLARTVNRRAERAVVQLGVTERVEAVHLQYLNRLSDWLFLQARAANHRAGRPDVPWLPEKNPPESTA